MAKGGWLTRKPPEWLDVPWKLGDVVIFVIAWFGLQFAAAALLSLLAPYNPEVRQFVAGAANSSNIGDVFGFYLIDAAAGFGVVWLYLRKYHVDWHTVGWRKFDIATMIKYLLLLIVGFVILAQVVLTIVSLLIPSFNANQTQNNDFITLKNQQQSIALIALVLLPPVLEETIFRGFIFPALAKRWGTVWGAVASSALFGIAHLQANISIYTFVLGLVLCFMYIKLKSIVPGMFLHMLNNYLAFLALNQK